VAWPNVAHFLPLLKQLATTPEGKRSRYWNASQNKTRERVSVIFHPDDCGACALKARCTRSTRRRLTLLPQALHQARKTARQEMQSDAFKKRYARRAGIEATLSQGVRAFGLRRARYRGIEKTTLQHIMTAVAVNLARLVAWWSRDPASPVLPYRSPFERLRHAA